MSVHEQFAEDLALYALGSLPAEERSAVEKHLESCADCGLELQRLYGDSALMALSAMGPKPPQRSRERLLAAVGREPRFAAVRQPRKWWRLAPWALAAALAIFAVGLWLQSEGLRRQVAGLADTSTQQRAQLEQARQIVETLTAKDAMRVTLVAGKTPPQPQGKAIYVPEKSRLIFFASNMPKLPPQKSYELWLIPMSGAPIPAGVFMADTHGSATVINPPIPPGTTAKAFAITVEPEGGSATPTMPIVMIGAGE
jgi:anti-sigma-K factor RskA